MQVRHGAIRGSGTRLSRRDPLAYHERQIAFGRSSTTNNAIRGRVRTKARLQPKLARAQLAGDSLSDGKRPLLPMLNQRPAHIAAPYRSTSDALPAVGAASTKSRERSKVPPFDRQSNLTDSMKSARQTVVQKQYSGIHSPTCCKFAQFLIGCASSRRWRALPRHGFECWIDARCRRLPSALDRMAYCIAP